MPQELELVYEIETGMPAYMHSVDANEAVLLGDYVRTPPKGTEPDPRLIAAARARAKGMNAEVHPEMLSPEERQQRREAAMQGTVPQVTVPMGTPVVLAEGAAQAVAPPKAPVPERSGGGPSQESRHAREDKK